MCYNIQEDFRKFFPSYAEQFSLKPFQVKVIENILEKGNTLCIMPTGSGKSLIYYMAGMMLGGITIVVSPLIALICEQEQKLKDLGIEVLALHSGISPEKQQTLLQQFAKKEINPRFIFASPEKLATDGFFEYCIKLRKDEIKLVTIDEVHCVSQWGLHFRPFYKEIPQFLASIFGAQTPKIIALTATLNPRELSDIVIDFHIPTENILKDDVLMRSEITLNVINCTDENEKEEKLWELLKIHNTEKVLVYVYRVKGGRSVEDLSQKANNNYSIRSAYFHGEMTARERQDIIEKFKKNEINVIFATSAFGMGIDINDIRVVIHFWIPESIEQYYQEIGRAARDKNAANAYLLFSEKNISVRKEYFIDKSFPSSEMLVDVYERLFNSKTGVVPLPYFNDEDTAKCLHYYIAIGAVKIITKGISNLKNITAINDEKIQKIYDATITKSIVVSSRKTGIPIDVIVQMVYSAAVENRIRADKFDKCLIVEVNKSELNEDDLRKIEEIIDDKKEYRNGLLDFLIYTISNTDSSVELHQEICRYLGADKESLGRIYPTAKGDLVRSKSEVIIANLLYYEGLEYEYEAKLHHLSGVIKPDFTVKTPSGKYIYWEHLGMLGSEEYDNVWLYKKNIYDTQFPRQLRMTYEGITINNSAMRLIQELKML